MCQDAALLAEQPGVISMESLLKLRRRALVKQESISRIARDLNLSRNTVKKYLKAKEEPAYHREHQPCPKLGEYRQQMETWLELSQSPDHAKP